MSSGLVIAWYTLWTIECIDRVIISFLVRAHNFCSSTVRSPMTNATSDYVAEQINFYDFEVERVRCDATPIENVENSFVRK